MTRPNLAGLDALLSPKVVAIIGASDEPDRIGGRPVSYMLQAGFPGQIYPVNPNRESVQGLRAYPSVLDVPEAPDACVVAVKASLVCGVLEDCAERGAKSAVLFSAGFAESGGEGEGEQARIAEIAARTGMRIVGPNCLGVFNAKARWIGTFASPIGLGLPRPGPISVASQSGAVGSELFSLLRRRGLDTGTWITTGNEADVDMADAIAYLVTDPDTEVIVAYAEGIRNGTALRSALVSAAEARKPVIFMKTGRSQAGAAAVQSHTAALAGSDRIYDAAFRQHGVIRVQNFEELVDAAYAASFPARPTGRRTALMTISGGVGVQMADAAADRALEVPHLSADAQRELKALIPFASPRNPVDVTAQVFNDLSLISRYLRVMLTDGDFDSAVLFLTAVVASEETSRRLIAELDAVMADFEGVALVISLLAPPETIALYEAAGYPVYEDPTRAVEAVSVLTRLAEVQGRSVAAPPVEVPGGAMRLAALGEEGEGDRAIGEHEAMRVLESWGIPCVERRIARSADEAVDAARDLGGAVVLKTAAPAIKHKSDMGGVILGVEGADEVRDGYDAIVSRVTGLDVPDAGTVLVARLAEPGVEAVVGVSLDPTFGPVVMVGLGGVLVELLDDVSFRLAPFTVDEARRMIDELKGAPLFRGFRGRPKADIDELAALLSRVSMFAAAEAEAYESVDLNPVLVLPEGQGLVALDALMEKSMAAKSSG